MSFCSHTGYGESIMCCSLHALIIHCIKHTHNSISSGTGPPPSESFHIFKLWHLLNEFGFKSFLSMKEGTSDRGPKNWVTEMELNCSCL